MVARFGNRSLIDRVINIMVKNGEIVRLEGGNVLFRKKWFFYIYF